jgi:type VI secretion system lysozyme-like protein
MTAALWLTSGAHTESSGSHLQREDYQSNLLRSIASGHPRETRRVTQIIAHLRVFLNTRQGSALAAPTYGLPDLVPLLESLPGSRPALCERLRSTIAACEPQLADIKVEPAASTDILLMTFHITARLRDSGEGIALTTRVLAPQRLEVTH